MDKTEVIVFGPKDWLKVKTLKTTNQARNLDVVMDSDINIHIKTVTKLVYYFLMSRQD